MPEISHSDPIGEKNDKILILDNASSPLSLLRGKNISTLGDATFGSLHHTKYLGFGEGGFAVIDSKNYRELNSITNFGFKGRKKFNKNKRITLFLWRQSIPLRNDW